MKCVILAGGFGTRLSEETHLVPKPMIYIGNNPILWHIMKIYSAHGINDFVICLGYKGYVIKEYFANYYLHRSDITFDMSNNDMQVHQNNCEPWRVTLVDTGIDTMTGGRLKRIKKYLGDDESFCFTYGDGVSDVNIKELIQFHNQSDSIATLTAVQPPGRFGALSIRNNAEIRSFSEKPSGDGGWINGGFFVLSPRALDYIDGDDTVWEEEPLVRLAEEGNLRAYHHHGYWQNMDTLRDKLVLEKAHKENKAPWIIW